MRHYYEEEEPRRYRGDGPYGRDDSDREWSRRAREERGFMERAGDEVRSWFGDEDAVRRRRRDEYREDRGAGDPHREPERDFDDRMWARQWGYVEGRREPRYTDDRPRVGERTWDDRGFMDRDRAGGERSWNDRGRPPLDRPWPDWRRAEEPPHGSAPWYRGTAPMAGRAGEERWRESGRHAGKGPRTYQRSDERIRDEVCERLACSGDVDATDVDIQVHAGEVTLVGRVDSRFEKRMAEDLAESVWGITQVHNQLRVSPSEGEAGAPREPGQSGWQPRVA